MPALTPVTLPTSKTDASFAVAINRSGQVAGTIENENGVHAPVDLGTLGGQVSYASDINNHGIIVGAAALPNGTRRAFLSRPGAAMQDLSTLGGRSSAASAVNDSGVVVGTAETAARTWHAFVWQEGKMTDLGALIGYGNSFATDINNAGHVVGSIRIGDERRAFVYRDGKLTVHPGGFGLYLVNAINDNELVIGAQYTGKQFSAAVMKSNQPAVVTHGGQDLLSIIAAVMVAAAMLAVCRRRYRGMAGLGTVMRPA